MRRLIQIYDGRLLWESTRTAHFHSIGYCLLEGTNSLLSWEVMSEHLIWALSFLQTIQMVFLAFSSSLALSHKPLRTFHPILKHRVPFFLAKSIPSLGLHSNLPFPTGWKGLTSTPSFVLQTASLTSLRVSLSLSFK